MIFWLIISALAAISAFLLFIPDSKGQESLSSDNGEDRSFYERRLLDIDSDLQQGKLGAEDADALRAEAARKLISLSKQGSHGSGGVVAPKSLIYFALAFVPVFSLLLYAQLGRPEFAAPQQPTVADASLQTMIKAAESRLEKKPDEVEGWRVLAPVYIRLGRYGDAVNAYENLVRLSGRKPGLLFSLGEAIVLNEGNFVSENANALFSEVLNLQPEHPGASYYSGLAFVQSGDEKQAKAVWMNLLARSQGNEPWVPTTIQNLNSLGVTDNELEDLIPGLAIASQLQSLSPEERAQQIEGMVASLAAKLEDNPNDREGWLRLVRSQIVLGDIEQARKSIQTAIAVFPDDDKFALAIDNIWKQAIQKPAGSEN